jgi:23S rRNA pseudouridine1911/1915/1917 synthase
MNSPTHPTSLAAFVEVIFEDDEIVVLNKPSGLLVLPDRYDSSIPNLYGFLKNKDGQKSAVHRIDKETSVRRNRF